MIGKNAKLLTVPANGQISIGKSWAGRHILVEEIGEGEIRISSGEFVPHSQKAFHTRKAKATLKEFDEWESKNQAKATDTKSLFAAIKKKRK